MGIMDFVKSAGRAIGIGSAEAAPQADVLKKELDDHGLKADGLDVKVEGDKVTVSGRAMTQEEKEKIVLAVGNVQGVATVDDQIQTGSPGTESPSVSMSWTRNGTASTRNPAMPTCSQ